MKNTVFVENRKRINLKIAILVMVFFCIMLAIMLVCFKKIQNENLNGLVNHVNAKITEVNYDGVTILTLDNDNLYNVVFFEGDNFDWNKYVGQNVTLITPQKTFGGVNDWVLGMVVDDVTVADYNETINTKIAENREMLLVVGIVLGVFAVATCALVIWHVNTPPAVERPLLEQYCEFLTPRQPSSPFYKKLAIAVIIWAAILVLFTMLALCFDTDAESFSEINTVALVFCILTFAWLAAGIAGMIVMTRIAFSKEIDFYAYNFPFDFTDISHTIMKRSVKAELQAEIKKERELHPHLYGDGGNGYDVLFEKDGVRLSYPAFDDVTSAASQTDAAEVFPEMAIEDEVFEGMGAPIENGQAYIKLSYQQLNFEAVPYYRRKNRPFMIMIKSRITRNDVPEEFENDLFIALDIHLLKTLREFDVPVENLQYFLDNKKQLMLENCYKKKRTNNH